jgi:hypothetical protein
MIGALGYQKYLFLTDLNVHKSVLGSNIHRKLDFVDIFRNFTDKCHY